MGTFEEVKKTWEENKGRETGSIPFNNEMMVNTIRQRVKKEDKVLMQYFWGSFVYHIFIYALLGHLFVRFWGQTNIMLLSMAGILLYVPFTVILMKRFKAMCRGLSDNAAAPIENIRSAVQNKYKHLLAFFRFKKIFDLLAIPVTCFLIVMILFELYVPGSVQQHVIGAVITFIIVLAIFMLAIIHENKKRFKTPLKQLENILNDIEK